MLDLKQILESSDPFSMTWHMAKKGALNPVLLVCHISSACEPFSFGIQALNFSLKLTVGPGSHPMYFCCLDAGFKHDLYCEITPDIQVKKR